MARFLPLALLLAVAPVQGKEKNDRTAEAEVKMAAGEELAGRGQFEQAVKVWREAARGFERAKDADGEVRSLLRQAAACQSLGQHRLALEALNEAEPLAEASKDPRRLAEVKAARGAISIYAREADKAEPLLRESLKLAREQKNLALIANTLNDLGIVLSAQKKNTEAQAAFEEAVNLAQRNSDKSLVARARKNMADDAFAAKDFGNAERLADLATKAADALPSGHEKAFLLMGAGQLFQQIFVNAPEHKNALRARAFQLNAAAAHVAEEAGDQRALAYALGYQGALYEFEKRCPEALTLTRKAVFAAQQARSPDALYRWQWQSARLLAKQGERDPAIEAYRRAVATLQSIRNDVSIRHGNRNANSSFREAVGGLYFELADLLLQRADKADDEAGQALLREARDTAELLKAAELEDYFQDDCVNLLKSKTKKVENLSPTAAIIYIVALPTRTELLVSLPSGRLERFKVEVPEEQLTETVRQFRLNLEDRTTEAYLEQGQQLYTWLIKPIEPLMAKGQLDTMVFVPDGALRTIPMSALHDGEKFLIEKYAVAVTPGLELMEAKPAARVQARLMISGLSEERQGFPALTNVPQEVAQIGKLYGGQSRALMNANFQHDTLGRDLAAEPFTIVHIASHGHFDEDVRKSFVLTFDKNLTLDDLERYIRPAQLRDQAIELLTLSACQTAAGDDRAALGLAGVAVKAGARAAFATLWFVNDAASTQLVSDFYSELTTHPERNKAQALQVAQKKLLVQPRYSHPCYWAPYLIIGNWL